MVTGIPGSGGADAGNTVMDYAGPTPPRGVHRYIFLLAQQREPSSLAGLVAPAERGKFDVDRFLQRHKLAPVGINFFTTAATRAGH
jgi:phosphatidylethanolamine-binding protein (PEBP) family uncharacterized protein